MVMTWSQAGEGLKQRFQEQVDSLSLVFANADLAKVAADLKPVVIVGNLGTFAFFCVRESALISLFPCVVKDQCNSVGNWYRMVAESIVKMK